MKFFKSQAFVFFLIATTINFWLLSKENIGLIGDNPLRSLSQVFGLIGIVLMSLSLILSTRVRVIENLFGGLDKVYDRHQMIGGLAFMLILNHPLLLVMESLPFVDSSLIYLIPGSISSYNFGIAALYLMILSFIFIVFVKLPYHVWKITHQLMGGVFLLSSIHSLTVGSDIGNSIYLKSWILTFIVLGLASAVYMLVFYRKFGPRYLYTVGSVERKLDILNFTLKPVRKNIKFLPGQFVFVSFLTKGMKNELHPFSISSAPDEGTVRISAKILGDFTLSLPEVREGDEVLIYGPYGNFGTPYINNETDEYVWIAGGIGITPFLSMLRNEYLRKTGKNIKLFYCYKSEEESVFKEEILNLNRQIPNADIVYWCSQTMKRLTASAVMQKITEPKSALIQICGPVRMMEDLKKQFISAGIPEHRVQFENFQFLD